jgi:poly(A) polymerase/tRNA nucleotidyltransferase (CCA-adding enzyme)
VKEETVVTLNIPPEVTRVAKTLIKAGFKAYLVGGCTRDLILGKKPKDWDITTNATPDQTLALFPNESFYENKYGTVGVKNETEDTTLQVIEVTTYRTEAGYSDNRRPDNVSFSDTVEEDLKRRDFTINAIALDASFIKDNTYKGHITDLYGGLADLKHKVIKTVGDAHDRFSEDALRIMRAIRLSTELGFVIDSGTLVGMQRNAQFMANIRDEFSRVINSENPSLGLILCQKLGVLPYISTELDKSVGVRQNKTHKYDVWEHLLHSLDHAAKKKFSFEVRLAALFHDIGKPKSRRWSEEKKDWTFHGHEVIGERITREIMSDLKFPVKTTEIVLKLVRWHMFFSDTEQISLSAVRRMVANVGKDLIWDLVNVRMCDRIGTGRPKESPYRLRKYKSLIEQVMSDPVSVGMLKIDGKGIMETTKITPGPKIGYILHALLEEVLDEPKNNTVEFLSAKALELSKKTEIELKALGEKGKEKKELAEEEKLKEIREKHFVE